MADHTDNVTIEWLILADAAQITGNKLYLLGGGWDAITIGQGFPVDHNMAVALAIRIPWAETNQRHNFEIEFITEDGQSLTKINGQIEAGRPGSLKPGQDQRSQIAINVGLRLEGPNSFGVIGRIDGVEQARTGFSVVAGPGAVQKRA